MVYFFSKVIHEGKILSLDSPTNDALSIFIEHFEKIKMTSKRSNKGYLRLYCHRVPPKK